MTSYHARAHCCAYFEFCLSATKTIALVLLSLSSFVGSAWAQQSRTAKIVVPFPPGGGVDIVARLIADQINRAHNILFVVENRPGAGTRIATEALARSQADGNTILFVSNSFIINPALRKVAYEPLTTFEPLCLATRSPNVIVVNASSPYKSLAEYLNDARAKPGQLQMAFQGPATSQHIGTEKLKRAAKVDLVNVPFPGGAPAANALAGGHVTALFVNYPSVAGQITSGKSRVLATAARKRVEMLPNIPTIAETTGTDFEEDVWIGAVIRTGGPATSTRTLSEWMREALSSQDLRSKLIPHGLNAASECGAEFGGFLSEQSRGYNRVIKEAGIKAQ